MIFLSLIGAHKLCIVDVYPNEIKKHVEVEAHGRNTQGLPSVLTIGMAWGCDT